jgi:chromate reductase
MASESVSVLGVSGSLRKTSANTGLLRAAQQVAPDGMALRIADLTGIPLYNEDDNNVQPPESVRAFKMEIADADALLIATPEYNYSVSGVLKNAIDWASRPLKDTPLAGKPAAMVGAGGVMGTVRAQLHLRQILLFTGALVLPKPELYVSRATEKFDANGNLTDGPTRERLLELLVALRSWVELLRQGGGR